MQELLDILNNTKNTLDNYYEIHKDEDYSNKRNTPKDYLEWIDKKTKIIINSPEFLQKSKECIIRGDVVWVEFGFNIGEEFSGSPKKWWKNIISSTYYKQTPYRKTAL